MTGALLLLKRVPAWAWVGLVLVGMLGAQTYRLANAETALAVEQRDRADERRRLAERAATASEQARTEEQRRHTAVQEVTRDAEKALSLARADAGAAADAAGRLRRYADQLAARCDHPASDPGSASSGTAAEAPGAVLADVLGRLEARGRELAAAADESRVAGEACQAAYLSLTSGLAVMGAE